jgi:hypothetical protein
MEYFCFILYYFYYIWSSYYTRILGCIFDLTTYRLIYRGTSTNRGRGPRRRGHRADLGTPGTSFYKILFSIVTILYQNVYRYYTLLYSGQGSSKTSFYK